MQAALHPCCCDLILLELNSFVLGISGWRDCFQSLDGVDKTSCVFLWLGGNILDHKNEPSSLSWEQGLFRPLALSSSSQSVALLMDSRYKTKSVVLARFSNTQLGGKDSECTFASVKLICRY